MLTENKKRINISVSRDVDTAVSLLAKRDGVPCATKASYLLSLALEIEEDQVLDALANRRDTPNATFVPHDLAWG